MSKLTRVSRILLAIWLPVIAGLTLVPAPAQTYFSALSPVWCLVCGETGMVDVTMNVLLFVPAGLGLRWAGWRRSRVVVTAALASLTIELLQLTVIPGRDPSLSDLITNTTGAWLGALLADRGLDLLRLTAVQSRVVARVWVVVWLGSLLVVTWLFQPWSPAPPFHTELAPRYPFAPAFDGEVLAARLGEIIIPPSGRLVTADSLGPVFAEGKPLEAIVVSGPPTRHAVPLVVVSDEHRRNIARLSQRDRDLRFGAPTRSAMFRFRRPVATLRRALPRHAGDTVLVRGSIRDGVVTASVRTRGDTAASSTVLSPNLGWFLVAPSWLPLEPGNHWLTALWIVATLLPLGYYGARGYAHQRSARGIAVGLGLALVLGLAGVPALAGWPGVHWSEWAAGCVGLGAGWILGRRRPERRVVRPPAPAGALAR